MILAISNESLGGLKADTNELRVATPEFATQEFEADKNSPNSVTLNSKDNSSAEQSMNSDRPQREKKLPPHLMDYIRNSVQSENSTSMMSSATAILNSAATRSLVCSVFSDLKKVFGCVSKDLIFIKK